MRTFFRYAIATGVCFVVNLGLTVLLTEVVGVYEEISYAIALSTVFFMNFFLMRYYIYRSSESNLASQFILYAGSAVAFRGIEYGCFLLIHSWMGMPYGAAIVLIQGFSAVTKFVYYKRIVF
jgi:putative flippase GtrA